MTKVLTIIFTLTFSIIFIGCGVGYNNDEFYSKSRVDKTTELEVEQATVDTPFRLAFFFPKDASIKGIEFQTEYVNHMLKGVNKLYLDANVAFEIGHVGTIESDINMSELSVEQSYNAVSNSTFIGNLRDKYNVDLCVFLKKRLNGDKFAGYAYINVGLGGHLSTLGKMDIAKMKNKLGLVIDEYSSSTTLAHELGHVAFGLIHGNPGDKNQEGAFSFSKGYGVDKKFASIMTYPSKFNKFSYNLVFSNTEDTNKDGSKQGDETHNARRTIRITAARLLDLRNY